MPVLEDLLNNWLGVQTNSTELPMPTPYKPEPAKPQAKPAGITRNKTGRIAEYYSDLGAVYSNIQYCSDGTIYSMKLDVWAQAEVVYADAGINIRKGWKNEPEHRMQDLTIDQEKGILCWTEKQQKEYFVPEVPLCRMNVRSESPTILNVDCECHTKTPCPAIAAIQDWRCRQDKSQYMVCKVPLNVRRTYNQRVGI